MYCIVLKSMTGFGRGEFLDNEHRCIAEIKAVNHRYNEIVIHMPKNLGSLEDKIRRTISNTLLRGRIDVFIALDEYSEKKKSVRLDKNLAVAYQQALKELSDILSIPLDTGKEGLYHIARCPEVLRVEEAAAEASALWPKLSQALDGAMVGMVVMRTAEGANIQQDLTARMEKISECIHMVEERAPYILTEYRARLLQRMRELLVAAAVDPDETRLLQETALFAERTNFTEELVRLESHLLQFVAALHTEEPVGRKLDFIVQEMNREINTIAAKANDAAVAKLVVDIKSEIEKVREQIQNIE